jgi:hypothetical protein
MAANLLEADCPLTHDRLGRPIQGPCQLWTKALDRHGYGAMGNSDFGNNKIHRAHRVSYAIAQGVPLTEISDISELDHLCRVHACCAPLHLEPVTHQENHQRGDVWAINGSKTKCPRGHDYDDENTGWHFRKRSDSWERYCRTCYRDRTRAAYDPAKRRARYDEGRG